MSNEHNPFAIDPELSVRLTAMALGEASDFERAQLEAMLESQPELSAWYKQLTRLHEALQDLGASEIDFSPLDVGNVSDQASPQSDADEWKLSNERRQAILRVLDGDQAESIAHNLVPVTPQVTSGNQAQRRFPKRLRLWVWGVTTAASLLLCASLFLLQPKSRMTMARSQYSAAAAYSTAPDGALDKPTSLELQSSVEMDYEQVDVSEQLERLKQNVNSPVPAPPTDPLAVNKSMQSQESSPLIAGTDQEWSFGRGLGQSSPESGIATSGGATRFGLEPSQQAGDKSSQFGQEAIDPPAPAPQEEAVAERFRNVPARLPASKPAEAGQSPQTLSWAEDAKSPARELPQVALGVPLADASKKQKQETQREEEEVAQDHFQVLDSVENLYDNAFGSGGMDKSDASSLSRLEEQNALQSERRFDAMYSDFQPLVNREIKVLRDQIVGDFAVATGEVRSQRESIRIVESTNRELLRRKAQAAEGLGELDANREPFSTFSLHVSDVSFKLAQSALASGQWPDASKVRVEEFVNAFDYFDPLPSTNERVACQIEQAIHPFLMQRNVMRVSLRTAATGRPVDTPLRLTLLLDNSGSMERPDRRATVRRAFETLASQLNAQDQVTLISFANTPRLLAERVSGTSAAELIQLVANLPSEGGTNVEAALQLALEKATEAMPAGVTAGPQNRVVMMTDGAVNLGDADPSSLSQLVLQMREAGVAFDAAGISAQGLNDEVLEALTRQGDGRYYLLDTAEDAGSGFADQVAGALRPAAKNVKVQVEFNPDRVGNYKLLGYERHLLNQEDFRNDKVDAAEMAAAEAGVALYHFEPKPNGHGDIGSVSVRFQDLATGMMIERRWPIPYDPSPPRLDNAQARIQLATTAALFAAKLRGDAIAENVDLPSLAQLLTALPDNFESAPRVQELHNMINTARQMSDR